MTNETAFIRGSPGNESSLSHAPGNVVGVGDGPQDSKKSNKPTKKKDNRKAIGFIKQWV